MQGSAGYFAKSYEQSRNGAGYFQKYAYTVFESKLTGIFALACLDQNCSDSVQKLRDANFPKYLFESKCSFKYRMFAHDAFFYNADGDALENVLEDSECSPRILREGIRDIFSGVDKAIKSSALADLIKYHPGLKAYRENIITYINTVIEECFEQNNHARFGRTIRDLLWNEFYREQLLKHIKEIPKLIQQNITKFKNLHPKRIAEISQVKKAYHQILAEAKKSAKQSAKKSAKQSEKKSAKKSSKKNAKQTSS